MEKKVKSQSSRSYPILKRFFDVCISFTIVLFLPILFIFIKIAFLITGDFYSIFYTQKRVGKNNKEFNLYKIRSMVPNADGILKKMLVENPKLREEYHKYKKIKNDPRITDLGKFLRGTSLDEFPQFFNVLKGDMSIVGNRPYLPHEKKEIGSADFSKIIMTKPGITGQWQISGRSNTDFKKRVKIEVNYSETANLKKDISIFFHTFKCIISKNGAS